MVWKNFLIHRKIYSHVYFPKSHNSWGLNRGTGWGGGRVLNEIDYFSEFRMYRLTTVIQHEVILSVPVFLRPTCNEDIIISKEVLQACHLDSKIDKTKSTNAVLSNTKSSVSQQQLVSLCFPFHSDTIMFSYNDRNTPVLKYFSSPSTAGNLRVKNVKYDCRSPPNTFSYI